jgi:hypothetical protein
LNNDDEFVSKGAGTKCPNGITQREAERLPSLGSDKTLGTPLNNRNGGIIVDKVKNVNKLS